MDDISDQMHKLSRELDTLDEDSLKYQVNLTSSSVSCILIYLMA